MYVQKYPNSMDMDPSWEADCRKLVKTLLTF